MKDFIDYCKVNKAYIGILLMLLYVLPAIINNIPFNDDFSRIDSAVGWDFDGRILSTKLMEVLSLGSSVLYLSPLTTFLAILILSLSGVYFSYKLGVKKIIATNLIPLSIIIPPFFLNRINYQFDFLPMSCAFSLAIISAIYFAFSKHGIKDHALLFLMLVASSLFYQADINAFYIVFVFCLYVKLKNEKLSKILTIAILGFIISLLALYVSNLIASLYVKANANSNKGMLSLSQLPEMIDNYIIYLKYSLDMYRSNYGIVCAVSGLISLVVLFAKSNNVQRLLMPVLIISMLFFISGPLIFFTPPSLGGRVMISFSAIYLCLAYSLFMVINRYTICIASVFVFTHYIQAYTAFNIQKTQYELDMNVFTSYVTSINKIDSTIKSVNIVGNPPFAKITNNTSKSFPVTNTKYDIFFHRYTKLWNMRSLFTRFGLDLNYTKNQVATKEELSDCGNVVEFNQLYNVLVKGQTVIFDFNKSCPQQAKIILSNNVAKIRNIINGDVSGGLKIMSITSQKISLLHNVIFEFNESLYQESNNADDSLCIRYYEKGENKFAFDNVNINKQIKIGGSYYIISSMSNFHLNKVSRIEIGLCRSGSQEKMVGYDVKIDQVKESVG